MWKIIVSSPNGEVSRLLITQILDTFFASGWTLLKIEIGFIDGKAVIWQNSWNTKKKPWWMEDYALVAEIKKHKFLVVEVAEKN